MTPQFIYIGAEDAAPAAPEIVNYPTLTYAGGTQEVGSLASVTDGTWLNSPTSITYNWVILGAPSPGEVNNTYLTNDLDMNWGGSTVVRSIYCEVTATNAVGPTTVVSNNIPISRFGRPIHRTVGRIIDLSGNYVEGGDLTYTDDDLFWDDTSILQRQLPIGNVIVGLTTPITNGMEFGSIGFIQGRLIVSNASGNRAGGTTGFNTPFSSQSLVTLYPTLSYSTLNVGDTINVNDGSYTIPPSPIWRGWRRNLANVVSAGLGNTSYVIQPEDRGHYISAEIFPFSGGVSPARSNLAFIPL